MSSHYYTSKPNTAHDLRTITYTFAARTLSFVADANVFSKDRVDFGSSLLIQSLQLQPDARILDLGCGYGPLGICAAVLAPEGHVTMVDINERAVQLAQHNILLNQITNATAMVSDGTVGLDVTQAFQIVLTNPPIRAGKDTVFQFYEQAHRLLQDQGELWVVIQKKQGADSTEKKLQSLFADVQMLRQEKGYRIYRAIKQSA